MKKSLCILLSLLTLFALAACNNGQTPPAEAAYVFEISGQTLAINASAEPILAALGEPRSYDESPSCAFEGLDKVYVYAGFQLQTYSKNGKDYIRSISLTDDSVATPEGIAIGATADQVKQAYGSPASESASAITYRYQTDCLLQFLLRDGKVTNVYYQLDIQT